MSQDFLVEIGTEELPPAALLTLSNSFTEQIKVGIEAEALHFDSVDSFATPRRLAVVISAVDEQTPMQDIVVWGPPTAIAFDDNGKPTKAAVAFAAKNGADLNDLATDNDGKAEKLVYRSSGRARRNCRY